MKKDNRNKNLKLIKDYFAQFCEKYIEWNNCWENIYLLKQSTIYENRLKVKISVRRQRILQMS